MHEFDVFYRAVRPRVLAACVALSGDLDVVARAADEAFSKALERWSRVAVMDAPGAWVQTVALNVLRRLLRRRRGPLARTGHRAQPVDAPAPDVGDRTALRGDNVRSPA